MFVIITGATGTGKSSVAVELAKLINGEVVSADSMQVYKTMDIGTGKIPVASRSGVPHHMTDIISPAEDFSAAKFKFLAERAMDDIKKRGKVPVVTGGTGLYINSIIRGIMRAKEPSQEQKGSIRKELAEKGVEFLALKLKALDPEAAAGIDLKNSRRVARALELAAANGVPISSLKASTKDTVYKDEYRLYVLRIKKEKLYRALDSRVDGMVKKGLINEVKSLINSGVPGEATSMQALGYKEIADFLKGNLTQEEAIDKIKQGTRNYAKRQATWFKRYKEAEWINVEGKTSAEIAGEIFKSLESQKPKAKSKE